MSALGPMARQRVSASLDADGVMKKRMAKDRIIPAAGTPVTGAGSASELKEGKGAVWLNAAPDMVAAEGGPVSLGDVTDAGRRLDRFRPALQALFPADGWDGRISSPLHDYPLSAGDISLLVKADSLLPVTGSIKARGGVYELLCHIEQLALDDGLIVEGEDYAILAAAASREKLSRHTVAVASTGNLGFSIGIVARAFGLNAIVHMSFDAKQWKKDRLRALGAEVVEHDCDYTETVGRGREAARQQSHHFIDDEASRQLLVGYAVGAEELIGQLRERGIQPTPDAPIVVYLPCGVGGAPGGIAFGLKAHLGLAAVCVFVEPTSSACMFAALEAGDGKPVSVYELGLRNSTIADGLAVPLASQLVLDAVGTAIDAVVAVPDDEMILWVRRVWRDLRMRLEPSAAAALAAVAPLLHARPDLRDATHIAWATGGSLLPDEDFYPMLEEVATS